MTDKKVPRILSQDWTRDTNLYRLVKAVEPVVDKYPVLEALWKRYCIEQDAHGVRHITLPTFRSYINAIRARNLDVPWTWDGKCPVSVFTVPEVIISQKALPLNACECGEVVKDAWHYCPSCGRQQFQSIRLVVSKTLLVPPGIDPAKHIEATYLCLFDNSGKGEVKIKLLEA